MRVSLSVKLCTYTSSLCGMVRERKKYATAPKVTVLTYHMNIKFLRTMTVHEVRYLLMRLMYILQTKR